MATTNVRSPEPYLRTLDIKKVSPDPRQPRKEFDKAYLKRLAASIKKHGLKNPPRVRPTGGGNHILLSGECRYMAVKDILKRESIPALIIENRTLTPEEALEDQIIDNEIRQDWTPMERANAYKKLMDARRWSMAKLCDELYLNQDTVRGALSLLNLAPDLQADVDAGKLSQGKAQKLAQLPDAESQRRVAGVVQGNKLSEGTTAAVVRNERGIPRPEPLGPTRTEFTVPVPKQDPSKGKPETTARVVITSPAKIGAEGIAAALEKARLQQELVTPQASTKAPDPKRPTAAEWAGRAPASAQVPSTAPVASGGRTPASAASARTEPASPVIPTRQAPPAPEKRRPVPTTRTFAVNGGSVTVRSDDEVSPLELGEMLERSLRTVHQEATDSIARHPEVISLKTLISVLTKFQEGNPALGFAAAGAVNRAGALLIAELFQLLSDENSPLVRKEAAAAFNSLTAAQKREIAHLKPGKKTV
jgi:ParB family chromosome partitioning protein